MILEGSQGLWSLLPSLAIMTESKSYLCPPGSIQSRTSCYVEGSNMLLVFYASMLGSYALMLAPHALVLVAPHVLVIPRIQ